MKVQKICYAIGLLLLPFSYGVKVILGLSDITWVNPTLLVAAFLFIFSGFQAEESGGKYLLAWIFISATIGMYYLPIAEEREKSTMYVAYMEPIRLALNISWFWVSVRFLQRYRDFAMRWLAISTLVQFGIALSLYLAMVGLFSVEGPVGFYLQIYKVRQAVWFDDFPVYRMAGTYIESPPFGLFMLCCFVILVLYLQDLKEGHKERNLIVWASVGAAFIGVTMSLSDQVLIGLAIFGCSMIMRVPFARSRFFKATSTVVLIIAVCYAVRQVIFKWQLMSVTAPGDVFAQSASERWFHMKYAFMSLLENPASIITGIGPGRYGDYAYRTGMFPSSVGIQVTPVEWIVEYGVVGLIVLSIWLGNIANKAWARYGWMGIGAFTALMVANAFQANWKWEGWFLAMAWFCANSNAQTADKAVLVTSFTRPTLSPTLASPDIP